MFYWSKRWSWVLRCCIIYVIICACIYRFKGHITCTIIVPHTLVVNIFTPFPPLPHLSPPTQRVDHCGYLTKLDSRLRPGKKRWFVLAGSEFRYYRNKESSLGRPRKIINLNSWCKLAVIDDVIFKVCDVIIAS